MSISNPYHEGELAVQRRANAAEIACRSGSAVKTMISARALHFIEQQPMAVVGSIDAEGRIWTSALTGNSVFRIMQATACLIRLGILSATRMRAWCLSISNVEACCSSQAGSGYCGILMTQTMRPVVPGATGSWTSQSGGKTDRPFAWSGSTGRLPLFSPATTSRD